MAPVVDDSVDPPAAMYPRFDHGEDLFVLYHLDGSVEFQTGERGAFVRSDTVFVLRDEC